MLTKPNYTPLNPARLNPTQIKQNKNEKLNLAGGVGTGLYAAGRGHLDDEGRAGHRPKTRLAPGALLPVV